MLVGYARVSTRDQSPDLQLSALADAGCARVFTETASGAKGARPELTLERTYAGLATAKAAGRRGGRKPALGPAEIKRAQAMLRDPTITVLEVAQQLKVPISTLYRHLPGGRGALEPDAAKG